MVLNAETYKYLLVRWRTTYFFLSMSGMSLFSAFSTITCETKRTDMSGICVVWTVQATLREHKLQYPDEKNLPPMCFRNKIFLYETHRYPVGILFANSSGFSLTFLCHKSVNTTISPSNGHMRTILCIKHTTIQSAAFLSPFRSYNLKS